MSMRRCGSEHSGSRREDKFTTTAHCELTTSFPISCFKIPISEFLFQHSYRLPLANQTCLNSNGHTYRVRAREDDAEPHNIEHCACVWSFGVHQRNEKVAVPRRAACLSALGLITGKSSGSQRSEILAIGNTASLSAPLCAGE